jgi:hypothetical protein
MFVSSTFGLHTWVFVELLSSHPNQCFENVHFKICSQKSPKWNI